MINSVVLSTLVVDMLIFKTTTRNHTNSNQNSFLRAPPPNRTRCGLPSYRPRPICVSRSKRSPLVVSRSFAVFSLPTLLGTRRRFPYTDNAVGRLIIRVRRMRCIQNRRGELPQAETACEMSFTKIGIWASLIAAVGEIIHFLDKQNDTEAFRFRKVTEQFITSRAK